jgi:hypothetical protein
MPNDNKRHPPYSAPPSRDPPSPSGGYDMPRSAADLRRQAQEARERLKAERPATDAARQSSVDPALSTEAPSTDALRAVLGPAYQATKSIGQAAVGERTISNFIPPPRGVAETASPMHARDRRFWVTLGIWAAILVGIVGTGVGAFVNGSPHWGFGLCAAGVVGAYALTLHLLEQKPHGPSDPSLMLIGGAVVTWIFVGLQAWLWLHSPALQQPTVIYASPTQEQIERVAGQVLKSAQDERDDLAKTLADTLSKRDAAIKDRDALRAQLDQLKVNLGPFKLLNIARALQKMPDRWALFITYTHENMQYRTLLQALLQPQAWILDAPDATTDLDAPKFPKPPTDPGFIFHGSNVLNDQLSQLLGSCFIVRRTDREIEGLASWFNNRLSEPERNENRKISWIEIGEGSPWRGHLPPAGDCLQ